MILCSPVLLTLSLFVCPERYKQLQYIAWLIKKSCKPTPFVYKYIVSRAEKERKTHATASVPVAAISTSNQQSVNTVGCTCSNVSKNTDMMDQDDIINNNEGDEEVPVDDSVCTKGERAPFCIACINWVRRLSKLHNHQCGGGDGPSSSSSKRGTNSIGGGDGSGGATKPQKLGKAPKKKEKPLGVIPLDNLLLFISDPGNHREPDKRTMYRLLQNLSIEYTGQGSGVCIQNPYLRFSNHIAEQVITVFKRKYFTSYRFDTISKSKWKDMRSSKSAGHAVNGCEIASSSYKFQQGKMMDNNLDMINDLIRVWWKCHGMPKFLQVNIRSIIFDYSTHKLKQRNKNT